MHQWLDQVSRRESGETSLTSSEAIHLEPNAPPVIVVRRHQRDRGCAARQSPRAGHPRRAHRTLTIHVPEHFHVKVISMLRRHALRGELAARRRAEALSDLRELRIVRYSVVWNCSMPFGNCVTGSRPTTRPTSPWPAGSDCHCSPVIPGSHRSRSPRAGWPSFRAEPQLL